MVWYCTQTCSVLWNGVESDVFSVSNGVRQGGVLSPYLFNVYMDQLSDQLRLSDVGCFMQDVCLNHFLYADDTVLLAPSVQALQSLIDLCYKYSIHYDILYNKTKTRCVAFLPSSLSTLHVPTAYMGDKALNWVSQKTYLGVILNSERSDCQDIARQKQQTYVQGNTLIRKFGKCSDDVKCLLFKTYCYSMYGMTLWFYTSQNAISPVKVAYNDIFRALFYLDRRCSVSFECLQRNISCFTVLQRKSIVSLYQRLKSSSNCIINSIFLSTFFTHHSRLNKLWCTTMYKF